MKVNFSRQKNGGMTIFEVLVVLMCVLIGAAILLSFLARTGPGPQRTNCVSNLRQLNIGFRTWEGDNGNQYPMAVSVTNDGVMELMEKGDLTKCLQCTSNEMCSPRIFVCPGDPAQTYTTNWNDLNHLHVSYFISADASNESESGMVLDGDDNLIVGGMPVTSGLLTLSSNAPVSWSKARHKFCGNIGFADGSVSQTASNGLREAFQRTGLATNRIVIP